jgi:hypothetical protein
MTKFFNPAMQHSASRSSTPSPTAHSFAIIGPCDNTHNPSGVFTSILDLLPGSSFYSVDYYSMRCEGHYVRVGFKGEDTVWGLINLWAKIKPLQDCPYDLNMRLADTRDGVMHTLFGAKN